MAPWCRSAKRGRRSSGIWRIESESSGPQRAFSLSSVSLGERSGLAQIGGNDEEFADLLAGRPPRPSPEADEGLARFPEPLLWHRFEGVDVGQLLGLWHGARVDPLVELPPHLAALVARPIQDTSG